MKKRLDRFQLLELVSESASGSVYRADEQLPGDVTRPVALKVLPQINEDDAKGQQRFLEQIRLLVSLAGHPHVVTVYAMGITDRLPWIAMELLPNALTRTIREQPGESRQVAELIRQVAAALAALHGFTPPVLHNDLTPSNILVDRFGVYKITDFTVAGPAAVDRTRILATVRYAAPELLSRELGTLSPATDLYALGHIAYEMSLGGKMYRQQFPAVVDLKGGDYQGTPASWMAWHCSMETKPATIHEIRPDFPRDLSDIIARMMQKRIPERYPATEELLADLAKCSVAGPAAEPSAPQGVAQGGDVLAATGAAAPNQGEASGLHGPTGDEKYFVRLGGRTTGPYNLANLQKLLKQGQISRLHKFSTDRVNWQNISTIEGLLA